MKSVRIIALTLAIVMALTLAACGVDQKYRLQSEIPEDNLLSVSPSVPDNDSETGPPTILLPSGTEDTPQKEPVLEPLLVTPEQTAAREAFIAFLTNSLFALYNGEEVQLLDIDAGELGFAASHGTDVPELLIQTYDYYNADEQYTVLIFRYDNGDIIARKDTLAARNGIRKDGSYHVFYSPGMGYIYDGKTDEGFTYDQTEFDIYLVDGISVSRGEFYALREGFQAKVKVDWFNSPEELISHIEDEWYTSLLFLSGESEALPPDGHSSGYLPTISDNRGGRFYEFDFDSDEAGLIVTPCPRYEGFLNSMGGSYGYALEYLQFEGITGAQAMNKYFVERRLSYHQRYADDGYFEGWWDGLGEWEAFDPVCVIGGMVSVASEYDGWAGGVGWGRGFGGVVFDLHTGEVLSAGDIFGEDDATIRRRICDYVADYMVDHPDEFGGFHSKPYSEESYAEINTFEFYLVEDALLACYDRYDLGRAGAQGGCIISVPFSVIGEPKARME